MTTNSDFEITNGKIKLPYNFNDEKYIIGIERKSDNTLMAGKTIIPIRDSKPSYILEITPKTYPTFYFKKNGECYELVKNEVFFNVNFIMDEIPLTTSDYEINVDWNEKYAIDKTNLPKEVKLTLSGGYHKINSGDTHYDILEQNNKYSDRINLTLIDNKNLLVYSTVLEIVFQKSYFETISKYDSIDISERNSSRTEKKKNVITIDGYYNDNKIDRNDLEVKFYNEDEKDIFTPLVSTMKYANIVKGQNEFYLAHRELSKSRYKEIPLHDCIVGENNDIYRIIDGKNILLVSGKTLYDGDINNKIIDVSGNVYSGTTQLIDSSGNIILNGYIKIDNSGNTLYRDSNNNIYVYKELINIQKNEIYTYDNGGGLLSDLDANIIKSSVDTAVTYNFIHQCLYSGDTTTLILDKDYYVHCYNSKYNFNDKKLLTDDKAATLYDNDKEILYATNTSGLTIKPQENKFQINEVDIIAEGEVKHISGFTYKILTGEIVDKSSNTIVTVVNSYNTGTTTSTTTGCTFNSGYTLNNGYAFYVNNINGSLNYADGKPLLSGNTIYTTGRTEVVKYTQSGGIRIQLKDGTWINFSYVGDYVTGYTTSTSSVKTFTATTSGITNNSMRIKTINEGIYYRYNNEPTEEEWSIKISGNTITYKLINGQIIGTTSSEIPIGDDFIYNRTEYNLLYNKTIIVHLNTIFVIRYITLGNNYYYIPSSKVIQYNSTTVNSGYPQVNLTSLTINNGTTFSGETQIENGVVKNNNINILNLKTGVLDLGNSYKYHYKNKKLFYSEYNNTQSDKNIICDFTNSKITKGGTTGTTIVNLTGNIIVGYNKKELVNNNGDITLVGKHSFNIYNKTITNSSGKLNIDFSYIPNNGYLILSRRDTLPLFEMKYYPSSKKYNITHNNSDIITIYGNNIIFNQPNYDLTATTEYSKESEITRIKDLNITIDNQNYSWDITGDIKCEGYTITNENMDKNFYYCDGDGNICFNNEIVKYVIDGDGKYYDLKTSKQVILQDGETFIDTITLSILPDKNDILDKYNNIKITKDTSYDLINKVEKDNNDKVITGVTTGESLTINDIFSTVAIDFNTGKIFDSNNRLISDISGGTINIEGGLTVKLDGINSGIYSGNTILVSGITSRETIGLTSNASKNNVTLSGDTVYYLNKKAYSIDEGGFYFEKKINELFNTGFTLSNGLEITPIVKKTSGKRPDYSKGFYIKHLISGFVVTASTSGESIEIVYNENDDNNPGFTKDGDNLIYNNFTLVSGGTRQLFNPRDPMDIKNRNILFNLMRDEYVGVVVDLVGRKVDTDIKNKNDVYYYAHRIEEIKKNIPDLISYMFKQNKNAFDINIEATYIDVMSDIKSYALIEGGNNNSSYKINVEPQFITQNMINNGSVVTAKIVNNNGDHIPHSTYSENNYKFDYVFDASNTTTNITGDTLKIILSTGTPIFNEIKFSLYCNEKLVNQEIIEVLGENKLITSVEYVDVSNGNATYIIQPTTNAYYNTKITWKNDNGDPITRLTLTSASTKQIISGYCDNIHVYEQTILPLKKGEQGEPGKKGEPGRRGKLLYPAGRWNSGTTYDGTDDEKTPFVTYKVYGEDKYYVLTATEKISGTTYTPPNGWTEMAQYEALYTKLLVAENGLVGGSVYNGDYVFSKNGKKVSEGVVYEGPYYSNFDDTIVDSIFSGNTNLEPFIPNYLVDFNQGRAWFGNGKTIIDKNGVFYAKDIVEMIQDFPIPYPSGDTGWDLIKTGTTLTGTDSSDKKVYIKNITSLNSYLFDDNFSACPRYDTPIILHYYIPDNLITRPNTFYKGEIYLGNSCVSHKYICFPGQIIKYNNEPHEDADSKILGIHVIGTTTANEIGGNKIEFLVKWDGSYVKIKKAGNTFESTIKKLDIELIGKYETEKILRFIN